MTWRAGILAACLTLPTFSSGPHGLDVEARLSLQRQKDDAFADSKRQIADIRQASEQAPKVSANWSGRPAASLHTNQIDPDVPLEVMALQAADINRLLEQGTVTIDLPAHGSLRLHLISHRQTAGVDRIRFRQADLVGSLSRRGENFFMTLPTASATYRVQGDATQTTYTTHGVLATRSLGHEKDFKHAR